MANSAGTCTLISWGASARPFSPSDSRRRTVAGSHVIGRWVIRTITMLLATGAAPHAWGQAGCGDDTEPGSAASQTQVCVVDGPRYARGELFGSGADALVLQFGEDATVPRSSDPADVPQVGPRVLLEMPLREGGDDVVARSSATVTFTLQGAVFADRVRDYHLSVDHLAEVDVGRLRVSARDGGAVGDNAVAFDIEVVGGNGLRGVGTVPVTLAFAVPSLTGTLEAMSGVSSSGVWVQVELQSSRAAGGFPDFPVRGQTLPDGGDADGEPDEEAGLRLLVGKPGLLGLGAGVDRGDRSGSRDHRHRSPGGIRVQYASGPAVPDGSGALAGTARGPAAGRRITVFRRRHGCGKPRRRRGDGGAKGHRRGGVSRRRRAGLRPGTATARQASTRRSRSMDPQGDRRRAWTSRWRMSSPAATRSSTSRAVVTRSGRDP